MFAQVFSPTEPPLQPPSKDFPIEIARILPHKFLNQGLQIFRPRYMGEEDEAGVRERYVISRVTWLKHGDMLESVFQFSPYWSPNAQDQCFSNYKGHMRHVNQNAD